MKLEREREIERGRESIYIVDIREGVFLFQMKISD